MNRVAIRYFFIIFLLQIELGDYALRRWAYSLMNRITNTIATQSADNALTSGVTVKRTIEKIRNGSVVDPGPAVK
jgi:hypothetical protein